MEQELNVSINHLCWLHPLKMVKLMSKVITINKFVIMLIHQDLFRPYYIFVFLLKSKEDIISYYDL